MYFIEIVINLFPCITIEKKNFPSIYNLYLTLGVFLSVNFGNHRATPITRDPIADSPDEMTTIVFRDLQIFKISYFLKRSQKEERKNTYRMFLD